MKNIFLLIVLHLSISSFSQGWEFRFGPEENKSIADYSIQTSDNGFLSVGRYNRMGSNGYNPFMIKLSESGEEEWHYILEESMFDTGGGVAETENNEYLFAGYYRPDPNIDTSVGFVSKFTNTGEVLWNLILEDSLSSKIFQIFILPGDEYLAVGNVGASNQENLLFLKINSEGVIVDRYENEFGFKIDFISEAILTTDNNIALTGVAYLPDESNFDFYVGKYTFEGEELWKDLKSGAIKTGWSILEIENGGFLVTAHSNNSSSGNLIRYSAEGEEQWNEVFFSSQYNFAESSLCPTADGHILLASSNSFLPYLLKMDQDGTILWEKEIEILEDTIPGNKFSNHALLTNDGGYFISGRLLISNGAYMVKLNEDGTLTSYDRPELNSNEIRVYPNPLTEELFIDMPESLYGIDYIITDVLGKEVVSGILDDNMQSIQVDQKLKGCYILSFYSSGKLIFSKKIIIQ